MFGKTRYFRGPFPVAECGSRRALFTAKVFTNRMSFGDMVMVRVSLMKRSDINTIVREADAFLASLQFHLPPFAYWSPEQWRRVGPEAMEIVEHQLGWDITDFGSGDFPRLGLFLFTLRNGDIESARTGKGKGYAEKIMVVRDGQVTPMHFHWSKTEDIINRGGGVLALQLYTSNPDESINRSAEVSVSLDGIRREFPAGGIVRLRPGESITLETGLYHSFWGEEGTVLVGEVSAVNDDATDNRFAEPMGRFPEIEEDEPPVALLVGDYARYCAHLFE